jgi:hypothetical protein
MRFGNDGWRLPLGVRPVENRRTTRVESLRLSGAPDAHLSIRKQLVSVDQIIFFFERCAHGLSVSHGALPCGKQFLFATLSKLKAETHPAYSVHAGARVKEGPPNVTVSAPAPVPCVAKSYPS